MNNHCIPLERGIFCNRTLNLKKIQAIGYDMDYTLIHYNVNAWEGRAYQQIKRDLNKQRGWLLEDLKFDPTMATRGLVIDRELGNLIKVNRFGYVKQSCHGTTMLDFEKVRKTYTRTIVDLADPRFVFCNTLFSISEACLFCQLVEILDSGKLPEIIGYSDLYKIINKSLNHAHIYGELKQEIIANPEKYVELDPEVAFALLDQKYAGKKLLLITNSEWQYTAPMMSYCFDRFLPHGMTWQTLFDLVVVSSNKPDFFSGNAMMFKVVNKDGLLEMCRSIPSNGIYLGGSASKVEEFLKISGEEILYVGDHIFADVNMSKNVLRWRTALIVREMEQELLAIIESQKNQSQIRELMARKESLEANYNQIMLEFQRRKKNYQQAKEFIPFQNRLQDYKNDDLEVKFRQIRSQVQEIDSQLQIILAQEEQRLDTHWGYLMRTGNDKSDLMRQIERHADIYTSRVSNFLAYTPFMYFRSPRGSLPHDPVAFVSTERKYLDSQESSQG